MLQEQHTQLVSRQAGISSQRSSLQQQLAVLEEERAQAKAQVGVDRWCVDKWYFAVKYMYEPNTV